ncbi:MarR family winged helix-turn-helix transcriptional regulator [Paucisalibacillus sp. EB02]|uniref:MarR family winged helix-turn-helix transcriptional regulator n=1 Tax=Paucisalibacillus sp. EB02 TaxID=1347087 RepID=UPI0005A5ECF7|nr:MarR family transcriptional regulator [Paucisalibacillus sp. EB02]
MEQANIFKLIHAIEKMNNHNIIQFTKQYPYPLGISPILVLSELRQKGPQKQVELAETLGYTKGAMTNIANKLVNLEFVDRLDVKQDKRANQLSITETGEKALVEAQEIGKKMFVDLFQELTEEEINQYLTIQEKLLQGIDDRIQKNN